ncbi:NAD(P)/FAD-dependent oxidoreductase [Nocardia grenadensis]|uniref:NAD(P)/FAD-dependent oxidoreductase n=1 Tax=Nocardia grenadensis TaxID=931537 RepID=UPI000A05021B|nr:FAD-dependent oxidoreductase [Nocardia grenadensis]
MNATHHQDIVIIGAGYTGMLAALRTARRTRRMPVRITVVNPSARFTERLRLHQIATGQQLAEYSIPDLLAGSDIEFRRAAATALDPTKRMVALDDDTALGYDILIYALGSVSDTAGVPGAREHAFTLDNRALAQRFSEQLPGIAATGGSVTVCGGGLTGIEAATEIAESYPGLSVTLLSRNEPGAMMGEKARAYLSRALDRLGIDRRVGSDVAEVLPGAVRLSAGELLESDLTLWTAGVRVPPLAADAGIRTDERGRVVTDATLRSVSHPEIYAVGDAAAVRMEWGPLHGTCQSGMPTAAYVGDTIARRLKGKKVAPFRFGYVHQPLSLGRNDAVIQFVTADETPRRWYLTGRAAVGYKETVSSSPLPVFRLSRHLPVPVRPSSAGHVA